MKEMYSETWNEIELQEDTFEAQLVYIPVDQGKRKYSYIYDLAYEIKKQAVYKEENIPMEMRGYIDAQYPYCYYGCVCDRCFYTCCSSCCIVDRGLGLVWHLIIFESKKER